jgi:hypothetical protein
MHPSATNSTEPFLVWTAVHQAATTVKNAQAAMELTTTTWKFADMKNTSRCGIRSRRLKSARGQFPDWSQDPRRRKGLTGSTYPFGLV